MLKNRFPNSKNSYQSPWLPDVQFEENNLHTNSIADVTSIIELNIAGMEEGQIYKKLQEMGINVTAYKWKNGNN